VVEAMAHLRSTVTVLRSSVGRPSAELTFDDIPAVLRDPALAGVEIDLHLDVGLRADPDVQRTVYRLVQEAVTNSLKHSDASRIRVDIAADGDRAIEVAVSDNGSTAAVPRFGHGLTGMQERVRAMAGVLEVDTHNGWRVRASLPVGGSDDSCPDRR
jgi:signal transduction histidine kinase